MTILIPLWAIITGTIALGVIIGLVIVVSTDGWFDFVTPLIGLSIMILPIFFWVVFFIGRCSK